MATTRRRKRKTTAKQRAAARRNIKKAQAARRRKLNPPPKRRRAVSKRRVTRKRTTRRKAVATKRRTRRRSAGTRVVRRRAASPVRRRRSRKYRRNPRFTMRNAGKMLQDGAMGAAWAIAGKVATRTIANFVPIPKTTMIMNFGVQAISAIGAGMLAAQFLPREAAKMILVGGFMAPVESLLKTIPFVGPMLGDDYLELGQDPFLPVGDTDPFLPVGDDVYVGSYPEESNMGSYPDFGQ